MRAVITGTALGLAAVAAVVQYAVPGVVPVLARGGPDALSSGQWWRVVTPLFVQTLGWYQVVTNLVTLALVGLVAEALLGSARWLVLFAAGTAGGQVVAFALAMPGGGDSIAICGLAGGVVAWLLVVRPDVSRWVVGIVVCYVAALTGWGFGGIAFAAVAGLAAVAVVAFPRLALAATVACAVALSVVADLHGVSLVAGLLAGGVLAMADKKGSPRPDRSRAPSSADYR